MTLTYWRGEKIADCDLNLDELDPNFWAQVKAVGWKHIDHKVEQTVENHGEWYAPVVDIVAQSLGSGFVGTKSSTVSLLSARRVEYWNQGVIRLVDRNEVQ